MTDVTAVNNTLQNIARQIGAWGNTLSNGIPNPTASTSPLATPYNNITTTAITVAGVSTTRHGIIFHNPGTATIYVYPSLASTAPTTAAVGGSFVIYPGGTLEFTPLMWPNITCAWSAFASTGSSQAFTVVEFF